MMRMMRRARGQATVELAVGAAVFVAVLIAGIYFAEAALISLKVEEANAFAIWSATGKRAHSFNLANVNAGAGAAHRPFAAIAPAAGPEATARYADFDGRQGTMGTGATQAVAHADALRVVCRRTAPAEGLGFAAPSGGSAGAALAGLYADQGGVACAASAQVRSVGIGSEPLILCGMGRAQDGACVQEVAVLLGDWGMEGPVGAPENKDARLPCAVRGSYPGPYPFRAGARDSCLSSTLTAPDPAVTNLAYVAMVQTLYEADSAAERTLAASRFAQTIGGAMPYDESTFFMSYSGEEHDYWDGIYQDAAGIDDSQGGLPVEYRATYGFNRMACWLGLPGC